MSITEESHPKNVLKFCPKCGSQEFKAVASNNFVCQDCQFVYYINCGSSIAAVIVNEKGEVLLSKRAHDPRKGCFDFPGGFVDIGETLEECLKRELDEELGVKVISCEYFCSLPNTYLYKGLSYFPLDVFFVCKISGEPEPADDVEAVVWVDKDSYQDQAFAFPSVKSILEQFFQE